MPIAYFGLIIKNVLRSRTRMLVTTAGCAIAAFIICFFIASSRSFDNMLASAAQGSNLVVAQKDRY